MVPSMTIFRFNKFLIMIIVILQLHITHEEGEANRGCRVHIWNPKDMTADNKPSLFPLVERGSDEKATYHVPHLITKNGELHIMLQHNDKLTFICSQKFKGKEANVDNAYKVECHYGKTLPETFEIPPCANPAKPTVRRLENPKCGKSDDKILFEIGYKVYPRFTRESVLMKREESSEMDNIMKNVFYPFVTICANPETMSTVYTSHVINGAVITARQKLSSTPDAFSMDEYDGETYQLQTIYDPDNQQDYFNKLEMKNTREYFDNEYYYFVPRQLTPHYDTILKNWKSVTYYYLNTAPQWQSLSCTFDTLEGLIRTFADEYQVDVMVYTGTHGVLQLEETDIHMVDGKVPVPKYFWKIAVYKNVKGEYSGMAFLISNNPHEDEMDQLGLKNICDTTGWAIGVTNPALGGTICCQVNDLLEKFEIHLITQHGDPLHVIKIKTSKMFF